MHHSGGGGRHAQADTPTLPENEGGQFLHLCMLRILFKCSVNPDANVGQIVVSSSLVENRLEQMIISWLAGCYSLVQLNFWHLRTGCWVRSSSVDSFP